MNSRKQGTEPIATDVPGHPLAARRQIVTFVVAAAMVMLFIISHGSETWRSGPDFHTLTEVAAALIAVIGGALALVRYFTQFNIRFLFIGCALFGAGFLDTAHAVVTSDLLAFYMPSAPGDLVPWSWSATRFYFAFMILFGVVLEIRLSGVGRDEVARREPVIFLSAALFCIACLVAYVTVDLPQGYYEDLIIHRPQELLPGAMLLAALILTLVKIGATDDPFDNWFVASLVMGIFTQFAFMPLSVTLYDADFDGAHGAKIMSYVAILIGLLASTASIFRKEQDGISQLVRLSDDLSRHVKLAYHDMREPLRGIHNLAEWIEEDDETTLSEESRRYMQLLKGRAKRLDDLIIGFRNYADAARHNVDLHLVDVWDLVHSAFRNTKNMHRFKLAVEGNMPTYWTDAVGLKNIFSCLFDNSVHHHDRGEGAIRVKVERKDGWFTFTVDDDGPGIEQDLREKAFEAFKTLKSKDQMDGAGIGLAVARKNVERHGGSIEIIDRDTGERGTSVRFTWPQSSTVALKSNPNLLTNWASDASASAKQRAA